MRILCPRCKAETLYNTSNSYRPFCSERCQIVDFGAWADEKYAVPVEGDMAPLENEAARNQEAETEEGT